MKLGGNYKETLEKLRKNIGNISYIRLKKYFVWNVLKFSRQFLDELTKNCTEILNNFKEKLRRNPEKILEIFGGARENVSRGA